MHYTINQLKIFTEVVRQNSITKASESLHLTQPAVSIQLKSFQEQFETPLIEVLNRKLYVTDQGRVIAEHAQQILKDIDNLNYAASSHGRELSGRLTITIASTGKYVMPYFLAPFLKKYPGVDLIMDVTNKQLVLDSLRRNEVDFSLISVLPKDISVVSENLMPNELYLVGHPDVPLSKGKFLKLDFKKFPMILREDGSATRKTTEDFLKTYGIENNKRLQLTSNEAVKQAVLAGLGISLMPKIGIRNEVNAGRLKILPYRNLPITTSWRLVHLASKKLSIVARTFIEFVQKEKETIISNEF